MVTLFWFIPPIWHRSDMNHKIWIIYIHLILSCKRADWIFSVNARCTVHHWNKQGGKLHQLMWTLFRVSKQGCQVCGFPFTLLLRVVFSQQVKAISLLLFRMEGDPHRRGKPWKKCKWASFEWQFGWYCFADLAICQNIDHGLFCQVYSVNAYNGCWSFLKEDVNWSSEKSDIVNKSELGIKNCNVNAALLSYVDILHFKVKFLFLWRLWRLNFVFRTNKLLVTANFSYHKRTWCKTLSFSV